VQQPKPQAAPAQRVSDSTTAIQRHDRRSSHKVLRTRIDPPHAKPAGGPRQQLNQWEPDPISEIQLQHKSATPAYHASQHRAGADLQGESRRSRAGDRASTA